MIQLDFSTRILLISIVTMTCAKARIQSDILTLADIKSLVVNSIFMMRNKPFTYKPHSFHIFCFTFERVSNFSWHLYLSLNRSCVILLLKVIDSVNPWPRW